METKELEDRGGCDYCDLSTQVENRLNNTPCEHEKMNANRVAYEDRLIARQRERDALEYAKKHRLALSVALATKAAKGVKQAKRGRETAVTQVYTADPM